MPTKTGSDNRPWVDIEPWTKPAAVADRYAYWSDAPPALSPRCEWWVKAISKGWRPNRRWAAECYDCSAELYGVYIWEFINVITPMLNGELVVNAEQSG